MGDKQIFLVIGMHRSGTSLVARCLSEMGLQISEDLVEASADNPDGFYEDARLVELNEQIETLLGRGHLSPRSMLSYPDDWMNNDGVVDLKRQVKKYLNAQLAQYHSWVLKDPRLTRLLPIYLQIADELDVKIRVIYVIRHPQAVINSKTKRDCLPSFQVECHWQNSNIDALSALIENKIDFYLLNYDDLISDPDNSTHALIDYLSLFGRFTASDLPVIRSTSSINALVDPPKIQKRSSALYQTLSSMAGVVAAPHQNDELVRCIVRFTESATEQQEILQFCSEALEEISSVSALQRQARLLKRQLKESNGKVFGLTEALSTRTQAHTALKAKWAVLNKEHNILALRNQTKIYRAASVVYDIKEYLRLGLLSQLIRFVRSLLSGAFNSAIKIRRSLNNRGLKPTLKSIAVALRQRVKSVVNFFRNRKEQKRRALQNQKARELVSSRNLGLEADDIELLVALFVFEHYQQQSGLGPNIDYLRAFEHFVDIGIHANVTPGPLFNPDYYDRQLEQIGLERNEPALLHWLKVGRVNKIIPTGLFDEDFFLSTNSFFMQESEWAFARFITLSVFNSGSPNQYFDSRWYIDHHEIRSSSIPPLYHYLVVGYKKGWRPSPLFPAFARGYCADSDQSPLEMVMERTAFLDIKDRLLRSPILSGQVDKAARIEPKIKQANGARRVNVLPYTNPLFPAVQQIRSSLKCDCYDFVVLIPHCRYGGSGLVAGELCAALMAIWPEGRLLLVQTDNDDFMRPDWFPENIERLNLLDFGPDVPDSWRHKILLDVLIGLKPANIFNVHSRLAWNTFVEYGDRLSQFSSLFGYTFCYDLNLVGKKVGYPVSHVPKSINYLKALFVDNNFLKDDLIETNKWGQDVADLVKVLPTPFRGDPGVQKTMFELTPSTISKRVFWAGRFDRQKKFDIVIKLAKKNPDIEFWVWGAAMLGDEKDFSVLPDNIKQHGLFNDYSELPFDQCGVWLYTSQWDGVPTILIELGLRAIPLVSSRIWGTKDLISEETAYPVDEVLDVEAYESAIKRAFDNPNEARDKASRMRRKILTRHSREAYSKSLQELIQVDTRAR